ncbi:MAG: hypothetical protein IKU24_05630 [Clostridia bacterium]|nr:hypothetical protein [Clostridia bacterium]
MFFFREKRTKKAFDYKELKMVYKTKFIFLRLSFWGADLFPKRDAKRTKEAFDEKLPKKALSLQKKRFMLK